MPTARQGPPEERAIRASSPQAGPAGSPAHELPMHRNRSLLSRLRRARPLLALPVVALLALVIAGTAAGGGGDPRPWPGGRVSYFDASGSRAAVAAAARRWNRSGARVFLVPAHLRRDADVVFVEDKGDLGRRHREGTCSLMNAQAYDDDCAFPGEDAGTLPCGPATGDVAAAARLYGRERPAQPCR